MKVKKRKQDGELILEKIVQYFIFNQTSLITIAHSQCQLISQPLQFDFRRLGGIV